MAVPVKKKAQVYKKAKVKIRHSEAISSYKEWLTNNPKASQLEKMKMFDSFVDSAFLKEMLDDG